MDQIKIGNFIRERRIVKRLTQTELAEKLGVTDRAVSKWENGISLPDASNIELLCKELNITINDLFNAKIVKKDNEIKTFESNIIELTKSIEESNKKIFLLATIYLITSIIAFIFLIIAANQMEYGVLRIILVIASIIVLGPSIYFAIRIDWRVGYYECQKCHHKYIPTFLESSLSMHLGRTKYLKCPKCGKRSWSKKVLTK